MYMNIGLLFSSLTIALNILNIVTLGYVTSEYVWHEA